MFEISSKKRPLVDLLAKYANPSVGGIVTFQGLVRNHNEGKEVLSLEYEIFESMALKLGNEIIDKAISCFHLKFAYAIHFYGHLQIGDQAVVVICGSKHRKEAYLGNQFIIDSIKTTLPIWKKEFYKDCSSQWVACHRCEQELNNSVPKEEQCNNNDHFHNK